MIRLLLRSHSALSDLKTFNKNFEFDNTISTYKHTSFSKRDQKKATEQYLLALKNLHFAKSEKSKLLVDMQTQENIYANRFSLNTWTNTNIFSLILGTAILFYFYDVLKTRISDLINSRGSAYSSIYSKHFINSVTSTNVMFSDVLGIDECRQELEDLVDYLKNPEKYLEIGAKITKGVLLTGSPGTGKTLLAKAVAGEAGVKFFYCSGSDFDEMFVGLGSKRMRDLFSKAKKEAPCILFIDEIDSLGSKRNLVHAGSSRQTLNQLLVEMDGFDQNTSVIVIAATNFPESLDKAIKRSGRFDKVIDLPMPDLKGRTELFKLYSGKVKCVDSIDFSLLAKKTIGMSGADIANLVNIAALRAVSKNFTEVNLDHFEYAIDRMKIGMENRSLSMSKEDITDTAIHEVGHALVAFYTKGAGELHKLTILPRGPSLGHTSIVDKKEKQEHNLQSLIANVDTLMGGRAAEEIVKGKEYVTRGCSSDLRNATRLIYYGIASGMFKDYLGAFVPSSFEELSEEMRDKIDEIVNRVLKESYGRALDLLKKKDRILKGLAKELEEKETMDAGQVAGFIRFFE